MKLLLITANASFEEDIKIMLKKSEVLNFSYQAVKGFRYLTEESVSSNWFASEMNESQSIAFYAFVKKENVDQMFSWVDEFNNKQETQSKVHLAVMNIERSN